ncbi:MAG: sugar ABC transporter permease, partial [Pseudorhodobacter sp.]|nr:sugar ABC transporter permease [Pseudorhodobacter sp.]
MTAAPHPSKDATGNLFSRFVSATEIDTRLLGMAAALLLIWFSFHFFGVIFKGEGFFLTPRNLWNLSVQMCSIGVMATGMVLVIVTRNIDLSVGSVLGFIGMVMGLLQVEWMPAWLGLGHPSIWIVTVIVGLGLGVLIGTLNGVLIAYLGIPSFIVTLGGLMAWRGAAFLMANGRTISPVDSNFALLGGGPYGSVGSTGSWIIGVIACLAIIYGLIAGRNNRRKHDFP